MRAVPADRALAYIQALGGAANIVSLDACTTRLRLVMGDQSRSTKRPSSASARAA